MMEAGSYFLHLNEFVECMQNSENAQNDESAPVGKILQAFSLSVADFLTQYQSQIIDFQNQVVKRRRFEDIMIFEPQTDQTNLITSKDVLKKKPTLIDLKIHLGPVLTKLKLLATICFTQKFIDDINEVNKINKEQQIQEQQEEGFEKFQELLYA